MSEIESTRSCVGSRYTETTASEMGREVTRATLPVTTIRGMVGTQVSGVPVPMPLAFLTIRTEAVTEIPLHSHSQQHPT